MFKILKLPWQVLETFLMVGPRTRSSTWTVNMNIDVLAHGLYVTLSEKAQLYEISIIYPCTLLLTAAPGWLQWKCNNKKEQKASLRQPNSILQEERQNIGHFFEKFVSISEVCFTCVEEMVLTFPPHSVSRHHCGVKFRRVRCAGAADNCLELSKCFSHYDGEL